ncbi:MAG: hypothetical protein HY912_14825 [Desulfomonile tiedjei]|uniref:Organic solvent tolerance-like N-terminal domain-containing protein n=1 Tax=Desulfomonile tiedjei TaxID=2358 RepID=A0A9D6V848_9BACT|nr:hypothetical protein [Desulfomonile tiedjei]
MKGKSFLIKYSATGLIIALLLSFSATAAENENKSKRPNRDSGVFKSATASGSVKVAQAEKDAVSLGEISDQPIDINAKKVTAKKTQNGQEITFEGNVTAKQGNVTLTCDRLIVLYDQKKKNGSEPQDRPKKNPKDLQGSSVFKSAIASGNVKVVQNELMAVAGKALFESAKKTITLSESPKIWMGPDWMVAHTIVIYIDENRAEMDNGRGSINPKRER